MQKTPRIEPEAAKLVKITRTFSKEKKQLCLLFLHKLLEETQLEKQL